MKALKIIGIVILLLVVIIGIVVWRANHNLQDRIAEANKAYKEYDPPHIPDFGTTSRLTITPLIDWHSANEDLHTEMGVSYFIETDSVNILFDLGYNKEQVNPSPLAQNMDALGISVDDVDVVVISHNHFDHVGGQAFMDEASFGINPDQQTDLSQKRIYTPIDMTYPGAKTITCKDPTVIAEGVATIGTISRALFIGDIDEQSLAVNVEDKGLVLIAGCSHQTVTRILERSEAIFDDNIYGLIGGLHYPVPEGRLTIAGLNAQRLLASGNGPFAPLQMSEVKQEMDLLASKNPGIVGVGGHDSSDKVIEMFHERFGEDYVYVKVGKRIVVN